MILLALLLGVITFALSYLHWLQTRSHFAKLINQFPSTPSKPFIGHIWEFTSKKDVFAQLRRILRSFPETSLTWFAYYGIVHVVTADDSEILLSSMKQIKKSINYNFLRPWLGTGLLTSGGIKWHHRRKILTPAFHFNILKKFVPIFGEHSDTLVSQLKEVTHKKNIVNVDPIIRNSTLASICETAMGTKLNSEDETQNTYFRALHKVTLAVIDRVFTPHLYTDFLFKLSPSGWKFKKYTQILHKFTNDVITERERTFKDSEITDTMQFNEDQETPKKKLAMLDLLLSAKLNRNEIDHEGIREEVDTFMFEGHDTTSMATCFALMELAKHHNIQQKIIKELDEIFGKDTRPASYEDLQNMKYLEMCLKECLRLHPSVPLISRELTEDIQLTHHVAPAGTVIFVHIYDVHRDPKHFPDPEKFDPNRFLAENCKGRHPYAYIPFSAGPRNCIGQKYAMLHFKSIVSSVFRNFTLESVSTEHDLKWIIDLVLRVDGPINVKFVPRN